MSKINIADMTDVGEMMALSDRMINGMAQTSAKIQAAATDLVQHLGARSDFKGVDKVSVLVNLFGLYAEQQTAILETFGPPKGKA